MQINKIDSQNFKSHKITPKEVSELRSAIKSKNVFLYDVDTSHGFMDQEVKIRSNGIIRDGFPVIGADKIIPALKSIKDMFLGKLPKLESVDAHEFLDPELKLFKSISDIHCQKGTKGAEKIEETVFKKPKYLIEVEPERNDVPDVEQIRDTIMNNDVIRIEKNENDVLKYGDCDTGKVVENNKGVAFFENLKQAGGNIALVYGVAEEYCVKWAVAACKRFGIKPIVIEDAIKDAGTRVLNNPVDEVYGDVAKLTTEELGKIFNQIG